MRPKRCRKVCGSPDPRCFKPRGIPSSELEENVLSLDEFEAMRLADLEGMYHEDAARMMDISRQTFGRILSSARKKTADAIVNVKLLAIEGGDVETDVS